MAEIEFEMIPESLWSGSVSCDEESIFSDLSSVNDADSAVEAAAIFASHKSSGNTKGTVETLLITAADLDDDGEEIGDEGDGRFFFVDMSERFHRFCEEENQGENSITLSVDFDLDSNELYENECTMSDAEAANYWYQHADIEQFKKDAKESANTLSTISHSSFSSMFRGSSRESPRESIINAHIACAKCKCDNGMKGIADLEHRDNLQKVYAQLDDVAGLENILLRPMRGDPEVLCRFVLTTTKTKAQRGDRSSANESLANFSQSISRPSRLLAEEIGMAFAAALAMNDMKSSLRARKANLAGAMTTRRSIIIEDSI